MYQTFESLVAFFDLKPFDLPMIIISAFLFVALWKYLNTYLFAPYLKVVEARESATTGASSEAAELIQKSNSVIQEYEGRILEARIAAMQKKSTAVSKAKLEAAKIIERAETESEQFLQQQRKQNESKQAELKAGLASELDSMVGQVTAKISEPLRYIPKFAHTLQQLLGFIVLVSMQLLIFSNEAFASAGHEGAGHQPSIWDIRFFWFNFALYCGVLFIILRPKAINGWKSRGLRIRDAVNKASLEHTKAKDQLTLAENQLKGVAKEIDSLNAKISQETEQEIQKIFADGRDQAERIAQQAKSLAEAETRSYEIALRRDLAEQLIEKARERLKREINSNNDTSRREAALSGIQGLISENIASGSN